MPIRICCPKCGRVLGDTKQTVDVWLNCRTCKVPVHIQMAVATTADYLDGFEPSNKIKEEKKNDKSK